jgi:hypothetical protein
LIVTKEKKKKKEEKKKHCELNLFFFLSFFFSNHIAILKGTVLHCILHDQAFHGAKSVECIETKRTSQHKTLVLGFQDPLQEINGGHQRKVLNHSLSRILGQQCLTPFLFCKLRQKIGSLMKSTEANEKREKTHQNPVLSLRLRSTAMLNASHQRNRCSSQVRREGELSVRHLCKIIVIKQNNKKKKIKRKSNENL